MKVLLKCINPNLSSLLLAWPSGYENTVKPQISGTKERQSRLALSVHLLFFLSSGTVD